MTRHRLAQTLMTVLKRPSRLDERVLDRAQNSHDRLGVFSAERDEIAGTQYRNCHCCCAPHDQRPRVSLLMTADDGARPLQIRKSGGLAFSKIRPSIL